MRRTSLILFGVVVAITIARGLVLQQARRDAVTMTREEAAPVATESSTPDVFTDPSANARIAPLDSAPARTARPEPAVALPAPSALMNDMASALGVNDVMPPRPEPDPRVRCSLDIDPGVSVGPLKLGMSPREVATATTGLGERLGLLKVNYDDEQRVRAIVAEAHVPGLCLWGRPLVTEADLIAFHLPGCGARDVLHAGGAVQQCLGLTARFVRVIEGFEVHGGRVRR